MVVVLPAKNGNAPQTPQPIDPRKKSLKNSFLIAPSLSFKKLKLKINNIINTNVHLQNANEMGGTYSTPPLATIKLLAIKMG